VPYKAILCPKDSYFLELSAYLHLNPVRGGLVDDPSQYPWSSYASHMGKEKRDLGAAPQDGGLSWKDAQSQRG